MRKSLALQAELGPVFDVTLDNEDGAPVGGEVEHAHLVSELLASPLNRWGRVGVRLLGLTHPRFEDVARVVLGSNRRPAYLMLPKPRGLADVQEAARLLDRLGGSEVPVHALIETHGALRDVFAIAQHPRIESLSFGLMDFVSSHRGAIPESAMSASGQFSHPLVRRAKLEIAAACHAHSKVPSHSVVTELKDGDALTKAAHCARVEFGYTRMWSIHPDQIRPIVEALTPSAAEVEQALDILLAAQAAGWAPIRHRNRLHDRASYRYHWQALQLAHSAAGPAAARIPTDIRQRWLGAMK